MSLRCVPADRHHNRKGFSSARSGPTHHNSISHNTASFRGNPRTQLHPLPAPAARPFAAATPGRDRGPNLGSRIEEATREGWHGEAEGLQVSLTAAREKLAHMDEIVARRTEVRLSSTRPVRTAARMVGVPEIPANG